MTAAALDALLEESAAAEACLLERQATLTVERDSYRLLARRALHELHEVTVDRARLRARYRELLEAQHRHRGIGTNTGGGTGIRGAAA